jgi:hypothetical protein
VTTKRAIGMTGYCHRGDHQMCPHTGRTGDQWRRPDYPDCACSCHKGPTGYCSSGNHKRCKYGPGRQFPDGIVLSDGIRESVYMCPCECHTIAQSPARKRHSAAPWTTHDMRLIADNPQLSNAELATKLGRTPDAIKHKRRALAAITTW